VTGKSTPKPPQEALDLDARAMVEAMAPRPRPRLLRAPGPSEEPSRDLGAEEAGAGEAATTH